MEIPKFVFSSFWVFVGSLLVLVCILQFAFITWNRFLRHLNIRKHGWPPEHLDADGDFKPNVTTKGD